MFVVGFTGTQKGMTVVQYKRVNTRLRELMQPGDNIAVHGSCIGADEQFGRLAGQHGYLISIRPGHDGNGNMPKKANCTYDEIYAAEPYLKRNQKIVDDCDILLATPYTSEEERRSGTWSTVRYAQQIGKRVEIIYPF